MARYLREVVALPTLGSEEQEAMCQRYARTRDPALARRLVGANLRLVIKLASRYTRSGADLRDLVQEGSLGLIKAVEDFDPALGVKLSTFAALWIRAYLLRYVTANWRLVKIGTTQNQRKIFFRLPAELRRFEQAGQEPSPEAIAARLEVKAAEVSSLMERLSVRELSLDAPPPGEGREGGGIAALAAPETEQPDRQVEQKELEARVRAVVEALRQELGDRETAILQARYLSDDQESLEALGKRLGMSREGVRKIEGRLLGTLRSWVDDPRSLSGRSPRPERRRAVGVPASPSLPA